MIARWAKKRKTTFCFISLLFSQGFAPHPTKGLKTLWNPMLVTICEANLPAVAHLTTGNNVRNQANYKNGRKKN
jgi:hypothetical protein